MASALSVLVLGFAFYRIFSALFTWLNKSYERDERDRRQRERFWEELADAANRRQEASDAAAWEAQKARIEWETYLATLRAEQEVRGEHG